MILYLDSSAVLRVILNQPGQLRGWGEWSVAWSSSVLELETRRTLDRLRLGQRLSTEAIAPYLDLWLAMERQIQSIDLTPGILRRAGDSFPVPVRALDAIHLATAMLVREQIHPGLIFAAHDAQQAAAARAAGFSVAGLDA